MPEDPTSTLANEEKTYLKFYNINAIDKLVNSINQ